MPKRKAISARAATRQAHTCNCGTTIVSATQDTILYDGGVYVLKSM